MQYMLFVIMCTNKMFFDFALTHFFDSIYTSNQEIRSELVLYSNVASKMMCDVGYYKLLLFL